MEAAALCELTYLHARQGRVQSAIQAAEKFADTLAGRLGELPEAIRLWVELQASLARGVSLLGGDKRSALLDAAAAAAKAEKLAGRLNRERDLVRAKFLRSEILRQN